MTDTGRIKATLGARTRRLVYGEMTASDIAAELPAQLRVDRAHVVMLAERKLIGADVAAALLREIDALHRDPSPLTGRPAPRGLYLMYEGYLVERLGAEIGGVLQTGRSRNDLKATTTSLRLRGWAVDFAEQAARLEGVLLSRARAHRSTLMPVYTHFQAAMPVTYGWYLLGVALAVGREVDALHAAADGLRACPLGAGAVAGTDLPIDPARTARLLGYERPADHALDAVAARDVPLRLLGSAAGLSVVLSRLATDLQLWSTAEFGFVEFPDRLVGGSSAMPQKRNAFLLEHLKAKPALVIGAWTAAAGATAAAPYTNSIEVGTEAVGAVWPGLEAASHAVLLAQVLAGGARPRPERMAARAVEGFTAATSIANRLVALGVPFRTAHHQVGEVVRMAVEAGSTRLAAFAPQEWREEYDVDLGELVDAHAYGGGPGAFDAPYERARATWRAHTEWPAAWRERTGDADTLLDAAVGGVA